MIRNAVCVLPDACRIPGGRLLPFSTRFGSEICSPNTILSFYRFRRTRNISVWVTCTANSRRPTNAGALAESFRGMFFDTTPDVPP